MTTHALSVRRVLSAQDTVEPWLSPREASLAARVSDQRRDGRARLRWLTGRLAAKSAVVQLLGPTDTPIEPAAVTIEGEHGHRGRPRVLGVDAALGELHVSISHAGDYVAAVAARQPIGVDIEIDPLPASVAALMRKAARGDTGRSASPVFLDEDPALRWTVLEAATKCTGVALGQLLGARLHHHADGRTTVTADHVTEDLEVRPLTPAAGLVGAVVAPFRPREVRAG